MKDSGDNHAQSMAEGPVWVCVPNEGNACVDDVYGLLFLGAMGKLALVAGAPEHWSHPLTATLLDSCPPLSGGNSPSGMGDGEMTVTFKGCWDVTPGASVNGHSQDNMHLRRAVLVEARTNQISYHPGPHLGRALSWPTPTSTQSVIC